MRRYLREEIINNTGVSLKLKKEVATLPMEYHYPELPLVPIADERLLSSLEFLVFRLRFASERASERHRNAIETIRSYAFGKI